MVDLRLYVEGGGNSKVLRSRCRQGFSEFLQKAGLRGGMPRIVACGGRREAFDNFCTALRQNVNAALLVDSEGPVTADSPWRHLFDRAQDRWTQPAGGTDDHCQLMVQCMETWFLADRQTLHSFYGQGFRAGLLPSARTPIESVLKADLYAALRAATAACKTKAAYGKSEHAFLLLGLIDPARVTQASPWADRFVTTLKQKMGLRESP